jgi:hypothetical protein
MENKKYLTVGTFPKFSRKMVERDIIDTSNTQKQIFKKSAVNFIQNHPFLLQQEESNITSFA